LDIPHNLITFDPTLEEWSKQGILLLNSALTVEVNKPNSHQLIWRPFISSLLKKLSEVNPGLIYVLWGNVANSFKSYISKGNKIYSVPHPAYYARTNTRLSHKLFSDLSRDIEYNFDRKIEWFKEEKF
jgi:uracil-DNA glycosylase